MTTLINKLSPIDRILASWRPAKKKSKCERVGHKYSFVGDTKFRCRRCGHYHYADKITTSDAGWKEKKERARNKAIQKKVNHAR